MSTVSRYKWPRQLDADPEPGLPMMATWHRAVPSQILPKRGRCGRGDSIVFGPHPGVSPQHRRGLAAVAVKFEMGRAKILPIVHLGLPTLLGEFGGRGSRQSISLPFQAALNARGQDAYTFPLQPVAQEAIHPLGRNPDIELNDPETGKRRGTGFDPRRIVGVDKQLGRQIESDGILE